MPCDGEPFLVPVAALARRIADSAVWFEGRCTWIGAVPGDESRPIGSERIQAALGPDLYGGSCGVAIFLAEAAVPLRDDRLRATALGAIRHAVHHADRVASGLRDGLYAGQPGIAYAAARIAARTGCEEAHRAAGAVLRAWRRGRGAPAAPDVTGGCAGAVTVLVALSRAIDEPWMLETATRLGDELLARANRSAAGWSWSDPGDPANHDLLGFSHGTAGIGHALYELSAATRDSRFRVAAERAFDYEASWFEPRSRMWPDLRGVARTAGRDVPAPAADSWCHGAPGIALSRLRARRLGSSHGDAELALAVTQRLARELRRPVSDDFSLCHGSASVADVLVYAGDARSRRLAADIGRLGIEHHGASGFPCGVPEGRTPGLLAGLAGVGLFYLRLVDPSVASVLVVHA